MIEEENFLFYLILIYLDLNSYIWLVVILLNSTDSKLIVPLCLFPHDPRQESLVLKQPCQGTQGRALCLFSALVRALEKTRNCILWHPVVQLISLPA